MTKANQTFRGQSTLKTRIEQCLAKLWPDERIIRELGCSQTDIAKVRRQMNDANDTPEAGTLFTAVPARTAPIDRHWFCPDATGSYCLACGLPRPNRRHAPKAA